MATLYVVATPIGNLEDLSRRVLRVLEEVDLIACEDTRQTAKILHAHGLRTTLTALHSHNMKKAAGSLLEALEGGKSVALVTDGGTPGVSDPGGYLVSLARERRLPVVPVPGPSALTAILSVAGAPTGTVSFAGFLSVKSGRRRRALEQLLSRGECVVLFESPHRILKLLEELRELAPRRTLLVGREMTKIHEEFLEGFPEDVLTELSGRPTIKGEFTVLIREEKRVKLNQRRDDTG
ncbi:MAG: 16S rRNA (cytidine(1402)-2'-O)-methyltransferase [Spirochaetales bacterium]|nr:16S rRNA (cytidine(1402)-2'-O)-methyltransferase [Spirochaetales bacterium]